MCDTFIGSRDHDRPRGSVCSCVQGELNAFEIGSIDKRPLPRRGLIFSSSLLLLFVFLTLLEDVELLEEIDGVD